MNLYGRLVACKGDLKKINKILDQSTSYDGSIFSWEEIANIMRITEYEAWRIHHVAVIKLRNKRKTHHPTMSKLSIYSDGIKDDGSFF